MALIDKHWYFISGEGPMQYIETEGFDPVTSATFITLDGYSKFYAAEKHVILEVTEEYVRRWKNYRGAVLSAAIHDAEYRARLSAWIAWTKSRDFKQNQRSYPNSEPLQGESNMNKLYIEVEGGVVIHVWSRNSVDVVIIDRDAGSCSEIPNDAMDDEIEDSLNETMKEYRAPHEKDSL